jgi:hypothetical protein
VYNMELNMVFKLGLKVCGFENNVPKPKGPEI